MRTSNVVMLLIALVCAAAAALLSKVWLSGHKPQSAEIAPSRAIIVAARDLKPGEVLDAKAIKTVPWASETLPKGAFLSKEALLTSDKPRVIQALVAENEPILENKLQTTAGDLLSNLTPNMIAFTIGVNDVAGLAGLVGPGDFVDVFLTYNKNNDSGASNKAGVVVLLQNVRVLAVDQVTERKSPTSAPSKAVAPKSVTLEVSTEGAQKLALARQVGQLSLALKRFDGTASKENTRPIAIDDFMPSQRPKVAGKVKSQPGPSIGVTRAVERKEYSIVPESR